MSRETQDAQAAKQAREQIAYNEQKAREAAATKKKPRRVPTGGYRGADRD